MRPYTLIVALLAFGSTTFALATPSLARQSVQTVTNGQTITGQFTQEDVTRNRTAPNSASQCYQFDTVAGAPWRLSQLTGFNIAYIEVVSGDCRSAPRLRHNYSDWWGMTDNVEFVSGGGTYTVRVTPWNAGAYSIRFNQQPVGGGAPRLAAGGAPLFDATREGALVAVSTLPDPLGDGAGLTPGTVFKDCEDLCPELVVVPAGSFMMGSDAGEAGRTAGEGPRHPVSILYPFAVGRFEVTYAEYDACVADGACAATTADQGWGRGRRPVGGVTWSGALTYAAWLSEKTGRRYNLLSEAEWEYVARAGTTTPWNTGAAILTDDANFLDGFQKTVPVGSYPANAFGLHDVHGNVVEWTLDCPDTGYIGVPSDGSPARSGNCAATVIVRGGFYGSEFNEVRSAQRDILAPNVRSPAVGFRIARAL